MTPITGSKQLMQYYSITQEPQILLPKNKYSEPKVALDVENAVVACKQSIHFFSRENERWREVTTVSMNHIYCAMSVSISGNTAVVGVPKDFSGVDKIATGVVYIYEKQDDGWREVSKFVPPAYNKDNFRGANVGYSVDIDNETIVIGSPSRDSILRKGRVFVLKRCKSQCLSDGWVQHSTIEMNSTSCDVINSQAGKNFGSVVSIRNNVIAASDGEHSVVVFQYNQVLDSYVPVNGSLIDDANIGKRCTSLALTDDGGVLVGCESNADCGALFYHTKHPGPSSGQYILHQSLNCEEKESEALSSRKAKTCRCAVAVYDQPETKIMITGITSENKLTSNQVQIYKRSHESWNRVAVIESQPDSGTIFGNAVAVSINQVMIASSNNVYAYSLDSSF
jgi:hypothetical protein